MVGADIFSINNSVPLCIVVKYCIFSIMKKVDGLSADHLNRLAKTVFTEFGLPRIIVSDKDTNFIQFSRWLNIDQATTSSYYHQGNG